jgi:ferrous iron transport protein A
MNENSHPFRTLADLKQGERAIIDSFTDKDLSMQLLEMGFIPGETVELKNVAPLGDPIAVYVSGYTLGLRKSEASSVLVRRS